MTRVAVIGAGRFGLEHLAAYRAIPNADLIGVLDADPARARAAAAGSGTTAFPDLDALLAAAPDAVSLVVPAALRGDLVHRLADAGVAVLIEKPLADDPATADALARDYRDLPVLCGHVVRFAEPYSRLRGTAPTTFSAARIRDAEHATAYPTEDVVGLTMVHDLDVLHWLAGPRDWVVTATGAQAAGRWTAAIAELRTRADPAATDPAATDPAATDPAAGSGAPSLTARIEAAWRGTSTADNLTVDGTTFAIPADAYAPALRAELEHFLQCARERRPSDLIGLDSAAAAVHLVAAVREALDTGGEVHVSA